jgi:hypothetical protein
MPSTDVIAHHATLKGRERYVDRGGVALGVIDRFDDVEGADHPEVRATDQDVLSDGVLARLEQELDHPRADDRDLALLADVELVDEPPTAHADELHSADRRRVAHDVE